MNPAWYAVRDGWGRLAFKSWGRQGVKSSAKSGEERGSKHASLRDTKYKEPPGYLKVSQDDKPAERPKGMPLVFTGCQFTFLRRLGKHCLAGLWLTFPKQVYLHRGSDGTSLPLQPHIHPEVPRDIGIWKNLKDFTICHWPHPLFISRTLTSPLYTGQGPWILRHFPLTPLRKHWPFKVACRIQWEY